MDRFSDDPGPVGVHVIIVVLSPHRDDAAFSLGLSIDAWLAAGHRVSVLNCFTQSTYAPYSDVEALHPNDRLSFVSALRKREDLAWNKLAGPRLSFHDLDLLDAPLRLNCAVDEVLTLDLRAGDRALARVEGAVAKLARKAQDHPVAIVAPLAVGEHIDHRIVRQAALNLQELRALPFAFYEDLPYAARPDAAETLPDLVAATLDGLVPVVVGAHQSSSQPGQRKTRLADCYDSQVDSEVIRTMVSFADRYEGRERLWANGAWLESDLSSPTQAKA